MLCFHFFPFFLQELGIPALLQGLTDTPRVNHLVNDTATVVGIADRLAAKVDRYVAALDRLAVAAAANVDNPESSSNDHLLRVNSIVACCAALGPSLQPAHLWRPSRAFSGLVVNRATSCELNSDWSPSAANQESAEKDGGISSFNLTAAFALNLASLPGLRNRQP